MGRGDYIKIGSALALFAVYVVFFTDWLKRPQMSIRQAPARVLTAASGKQVAPPAVFDLMAKYPLTSVKVVPWRDGKYNQYATPVWSLSTKSNSTPTKSLVYGMPVPGMTAQKGPEPLKPGETYHLVVEAGKLKGELDFKPAEVVQEAATTE